MRCIYGVFSPGGVQKYNKAIENEVERIAPLLNKDRRKKWHSLFKKNDPQLLLEIKSFWVNKDPTPTTATNERLLEHWQRIAHARKNFRNGKNTVYGTDDRGLIYVKYGEPERIARGSLGTKRADFKVWTDFLLDGEETIAVVCNCGVCNRIIWELVLTRQDGVHSDLRVRQCNQGDIRKTLFI